MKKKKFNLMESVESSVNIYFDKLADVKMYTEDKDEEEGNNEPEESSEDSPMDAPVIEDEPVESIEASAEVVEEEPVNDDEPAPEEEEVEEVEEVDEVDDIDSSEEDSEEEIGSERGLNDEHKKKIRSWLYHNDKLNRSSFEGMVNQLDISMEESDAYIYNIASYLLTKYLDEQDNNKEDQDENQEG